MPHVLDVPYKQNQAIVRKRLFGMFSHALLVEEASKRSQFEQNQLKSND